MTPKTVLITGCSTGIGRATAERLAGKGHTVYATARKLEAIADLQAGGCRTLALDVCDEDSMHAAVNQVLEDEGRIDALVNNAGYSQSGAIETVSMEALRRQFETNVFGLMRMCQLVLPAMRDQGSGRIINISSMGANLVFPGGGVYHSTKFAVNAISDALRFEVKGFGVRVVTIEPGAIRTNFDQAALASLAENADDGPYSDFNSAVGKITKDAYERGVLKLFGGPPSRVAKLIEKSITTGRPRARYRVTPSAKLMVAQRKLMTDGMWDAFVGTQFPRPGS